MTLEGAALRRIALSNALVDVISVPARLGTAHTRQDQGKRHCGTRADAKLPYAEATVPGDEVSTNRD
jgi:hypothetical protein